MTLPKAIHEGHINVAGVRLRTYVLDDGRRIVSSEDMHSLVSALEAGACPSPREMAEMRLWAADKPTGPMQ